MSWGPVYAAINSSWSLILHHFHQRQLCQWCSECRSDAWPRPRRTLFFMFKVVKKGDSGNSEASPPLSQTFVLPAPVMCTVFTPFSLQSGCSNRAYPHAYALCYLQQFPPNTTHTCLLARRSSSAPSLLLAISSTATDTPFTAEDVTLKSVAAPQSREADPLQSNHLL